MIAMRHYFYTLTARGELLHEGIAIDDEQFRDIFFGNLQPNKTGLHVEYPFCSPCGVEMNYLRPEDTPYVFLRFDGERLYYAPRRYVRFNPEDLAFADGVLYHRAPHNQWGRISATVLSDIATMLVPWGEWYAIQWNDEQVVIPPRSMPEHLRLIRPRADNRCVGCGRDNPCGLQITALFDASRRCAESWLVVPEHTTGSLEIMHGGFVALVLDEIMGKVLSGMGIKAPTAELSVRYRAPVRIGTEVHLHAEYIGGERRAHRVHGRVCDAATNAVLAEAEAVFVVPRSTIG